MEKYREIEKSIIKKFRKDIWSKFVKGIKDYQLIKPGDKIAVCISGGKDSFILAKCMQELQRHGQFMFDLEFIVMDPGYTEENRNKIIENAKLMAIPITIFETDIFSVANKLNEESPCYMCARMRRGHLYNKAKELGCNKIALGHHFDDVIETILLSVLYGGEFKTMMPKLHSENFEGMELIRPLYLVKESAIIAWKDYNELNFLNCACKFTMDNSYVNTSKRKEIKELINDLRKKNKYIEYNIFKSAEKVNLNTVISYHNEVVEKHFLDEYDKTE
jgi:tRNA 2-thiocytidine biosynthesis protein TtcA